MSTADKLARMDSQLLEKLAKLTDNLLTAIHLDQQARRKGHAHAKGDPLSKAYSEAEEFLDDHGLI